MRLLHPGCFYGTRQPLAQRGSAGYLLFRGSQRHLSRFLSGAPT